MPKATEKRRFFRFINNTEVKIKNGNEMVSYCTKDFSAGGFRIDYTEGFEIGQIVDVVIDFDCGEFVAQAKIKWQEKDQGIGFEFVDIELFS